LQEQVKDQLAKARSSQPLEQKVSPRTENYVDELQSQLDAARDRLTALETEVRELEHERKALLQERQEERGSLASDMKDEEEEDEELAEERRKQEEAMRQWQQVLPRQTLRAKAKCKTKRSGPYVGSGDYSEI